MFRHIYLATMGAGIGAVAAASCGHPPLWIGIGIALGLLWARLAPEPVRTTRPDHRQASLRSWLNQVAALRRVTFVIGVA